MNLYNTLARRNMVLAQIEEAEGDMSPELIELLTISDDRLQEGILEILGLRETAQTNILGAKAEIARLQEFIGSNERAVTRFDTILKAATIRVCVINAGTFRLSTRPSVGVLLAADFKATEAYGKWQEPTEGYYVADKTAIRKALEAGTEIAGAELDKRLNLVVK